MDSFKKHFPLVLFLWIILIFRILFWVDFFTTANVFSWEVSILMLYVMRISPIAALIYGLLKWRDKNVLSLPFVTFIAALIYAIQNTIILPLYFWTFSVWRIKSFLLLIFPIFFYLIFYLWKKKKLSVLWTIVLWIILVLLCLRPVYDTVHSLYNEIVEGWISLYSAVRNVSIITFKEPLIVTWYPILATLIWIIINRLFTYFTNKKAVTPIE